MTMEASKYERMSTDELFRNYAPFVSRFLLRLGVKEDAVDDAVQEVFLVAHKSGGYVPGPAKPSTYLATIAVHAAAAQRRAQKAGAARRASDELDELAAPERDPAEILESRDSLRQLQTALDRLDDNLRTTLLMADGIGQTCPTIASAMNVPLGTVYWRLDRARKQFRVAWRSVGAGGAPHRNPDSDGSIKRDRPRRKVGAWVAVLPGSLGFGDARAWLRASCEPTADELASARSATLPRALTASDGTQPGWAAGLHASPPTGSLLGLGALELTTLSAIAAAAIAVCTYLGVRQSAPDSSLREQTASGTLQASAPTPVPALHRAAAARPEARTTRATTSADAPAPAEPPTGSKVSSSAPEASLTSAAPFVRTRAVQTGATPSAPQPFTLGTARGEAKKAGLSRGSAGSTTRRLQPAALRPARADSAATQAQLLEAREVARAERMLTTHPHEALQLVRNLPSRVGTDALREERDYVEIMALFRIGRASEARAASTRFLRTYPESAFAGAIVSTARRLSTDS